MPKLVWKSVYLFLQKYLFLFFLSPALLVQVSPHLLYRNPLYFALQPGNNIQVHERPRFQRTALVPFQLFF